MPHRFNDPSKKRWYWGWQVAFLWCSRLNRFRYPRTWQVIVSPVWFRQVFCALGRNSPCYQAIWTLAACEGGSSPTVRLEFRTVHHRKLFWERLLLFFFFCTHQGFYTENGLSVPFESQASCNLNRNRFISNLIRKQQFGQRFVSKGVQCGWNWGRTRKQ